jgi:hypothetical protein
VIASRANWERKLEFAPRSWHALHDDSVPPAVAHLIAVFEFVSAIGDVAPDHTFRHIGPSSQATELEQRRVVSSVFLSVAGSNCLFRSNDRFSIGKRFGAPGRIASALRASSLRDHRRYAPVPNFAVGEVVEPACCLSAVRIEAPDCLMRHAVLVQKISGAPGRIRTADTLVRSSKGQKIWKF